MQLDERITRYLDKCPPAVSGSDGSGATFRVAVALVRGFKLSSQEALRFMEMFNARCDPPWKTSELKHKLDDAAKVSRAKPDGYLLGKNSEGAPANRFQPTPVPLRAKTGLSGGKNTDFGTVGTVCNELRADAYIRTRVHAHTRACRNAGLRPSQPSQLVSDSPLLAENPEPGPSQPSQNAEITEGPEVEFPPLVPVEGCRVGRPPEIEVDDDTWRAVEASGFAEEPMVQFALQMFGPGCQVISEENAR